MKTKFFLFILLIFVSLDHISAQAPSIQWQKSFGGSGYDGAFGVEQTKDGGFITTGWSTSNNGDVTGAHGGSDGWLLKLNSQGGIQWQKSLGGTSWDEAYAVTQTNDGGYITAGRSNLNRDYDFWVVKVDNAGAIQWQKFIGGVEENGAYGIKQTTNGGFIVSGRSNLGISGSYNYWIIKLDTIGAIEWQKSLGGTGIEDSYGVQQTTDGGCVVAGRSASTDGDVTGNHGDYDYWIVKLDSTGVLQWQKSLGGTGDDEALAVQQTTDGGYIVAGGSTSIDGDVSGNHGMQDYWLVKLDSLGMIQWQKSLGGIYNDRATAVQQTTDGGYIVAGYSLGDYWVVKLDSSGVTQWDKFLGGSDNDEAWTLQQTVDGGYIVAGLSYSKDGDVTGNHGQCDFWIVKLSHTVGINEPSASENSFSIFPNPSKNRFTIYFNNALSNALVQIGDMMGKEVYTERVSGNRQTINTKLGSGIYFVKVTDDEKEYIRKLIVE